MLHPLTRAIALAFFALPSFASPVQSTEETAARGTSGDVCAPDARNPEQAPLFDPACNAYMTARARTSSAPVVAPVAILPLNVVVAPPPSRPEVRVAPLASARALSRSPESLPRETRFSEGAITLPATFRVWENRVRLDANAQLMRPVPDRVGVAVAAVAEYAGASGLILRAQTQGRPTSERFALTFGAAAEYEPAPLLKLRAATDLEEQGPRYQFGARYNLVPKHVDIQVGGTRRPGYEAEGWAWDAALTFRTPFLN